MKPKACSCPPFDPGSSRPVQNQLISSPAFDGITANHDSQHSLEAGIFSLNQLEIDLQRPFKFIEPEWHKVFSEIERDD